MNNPTFLLELKNALLCFLFLCLALVFIKLLIKDRELWERPYYNAMVGIMTFFIAASFNQGWYWAWRHYGEGRSGWFTAERYAMLLSTDLMMAVGCACIIRSFTMERFGHKFWLLIIFGAPAFAYMATLLPD